ncbi:YrvL family regulatory protein [Lentibacillus sp. N15]|uniref:YrvL family regulatory protein n=1 Tax=Lentibacillus songyuanensis TaxID=3136161 RepID=UPI0031BA57B2
MKGNIKTIISMTVFAVIIIGLLLGVYLFGIAGIFEVLGVQYKSNWSLLIFVIGFFILGLLVDLVLGAMADISAKKVSGKITAFVIRFIFGFVTNLIVIFTVDEFMSSISLSPGTKLVISLILTIFESALGSDYKNDRKEVA